MRAFLTSIFFGCCTACIWGQSVVATDEEALVRVHFTDFEEQPMTQERLVFQGVHNGITREGVTDETGKVEVLLPEGDLYLVKIVDVVREQKHHELEVPVEIGPQNIVVFLKYAPPPTVTLRNVFFDTDSARLRPESYPQLDRLVDYLKRKKFLRVEIAGHTDNAGDSLANMALSLARAKAVLRYIVQQGIPFYRVTAKGYGPNEPIAPNDSPENMQLNRRVEARFIDDL